MIHQWSFVAGLLTLIFGLAFCIRDKLRSLSVAFLILTATLAGWLLSFSWMYAAADECQALSAARVAYVFVPLIAPAVNLFIVILLRRQSRVWYRFWLFAAWVIALGFVVVSQLTPRFLSSITRWPWGYYPVYGWVGVLFVLFFLVNLAVPIIILIREQRAAAHLEKALAGPQPHVPTWRRLQKVILAVIHPRRAPRSHKLLWLIVAFAVCYGGAVDFLFKYPPWGSAFLFISTLPFLPSGPPGYVFIFLFTGISSYILWHRYFYVTRTAEEILAGALPAWVVQRIERGETENFEVLEGAVLFADIVGFTSLIRNLNVLEQVVLLQVLFSEFDRLAEKYHVERIKTIGDGYMAFSWDERGYKMENASVHLARMAVEMVNAVKDGRLHLPQTRQSVALRIGLAKGPVAGGVIRSNRWTYDVWGVTVNMASRMESTSASDRIAVTEAIKDGIEAALGRGNIFQFVEQEEIDVKGVEEKVRRWFLEQLHG